VQVDNVNFVVGWLTAPTIVDAKIEWEITIELFIPVIFMGFQ
jgi:hypothetical protein